MNVIVNYDNGKRKEFETTLEAFAYEQAAFMMKENDMENADDFHEELASALYDYLLDDENALNYDGIDSIFEKLYSNYSQKEIYLIKISYSWGDEESDIKCQSKSDAWSEAKSLAIDEAEIYALEHGCEVGLSFDKENGTITLHYTDDDTYCYYNIVPF